MEDSIALASNKIECEWKDYSSLQVLIPLLVTLLLIGIAVGIYFLLRCKLWCFREKKPVEVEVVVDSEKGPLKNADASSRINSDEDKPKKVVFEETKKVIKIRPKDKFTLMKQVSLK